MHTEDTHKCHAKKKTMNMDEKYILISSWHLDRDYRVSIVPILLENKQIKKSSLI